MPPTSRTAPPLTAKPRPVAKFQPQQFEKLFAYHGLRLRWSRCLLCSCRLNAQTGQPDPTCTTCGGNGWRYVNPAFYDEPELDHDYVEIKGVVSSTALDTDIYREMGEFTLGNALLTVPGGLDVGFRDRFVCLDHHITYSEVLVRGAVADPLVKVGHATRTTEERLRVMRYAPLRINFVGDQTTTWYPIQDFIFREPEHDEVQKLEWLPGKGPAEGDRYAVHYTCNPVWIVDDAVYTAQQALGPQDQLKGAAVIQRLPTTFKVRLDFLTEAAK